MFVFSNCLDSNTEYEENPTFTIESEADFPSLAPFDIASSEGKFSLDENVSQQKGGLLKNVPLVAFMKKNKKRKTSS